MNTESNIKPSRKRKRTKNTVSEQYEIYLDFMEKNYALRSGTINPTLGDNYLEQKWLELSNALNAVDDGPILTVEEWKKRFLDWKYATKAKFRKIQEHRKKTGSGPQTDIKLTSLEEKALSVWGLAVVTGIEHVNDYDGLNAVVIEPETIVNISSNHRDELILNNNVDEHENVVLFCNDENIPPNLLSIQKKNTKKTFKRPKPLSAIAEQLLSEIENNSNALKGVADAITSSVDKYVEMRKKEIDFKISVYKFENPNFEYPCN